ncbi:MAG: NINE protein [Bacilli bacterium]|jgi:TM2 domain-containing membrane protein YozV
MDEHQIRQQLHARKEDIESERFEEIVAHLLTKPDHLISEGFRRMKETMATVLFAVFLGALGADMFYIKKTKRALVKLTLILIAILFALLGFVMMIGTIATSAVQGGGNPDNAFLPLMWVFFVVAIVLAMINLILWTIDISRAKRLTQAYNTKVLLNL